MCRFFHASLATESRSPCRSSRCSVAIALAVAVAGPGVLRSSFKPPNFKHRRTITTNHHLHAQPVCLQGRQRQAEEPQG